MRFKLELSGEVDTPAVRLAALLKSVDVLSSSLQFKSFTTHQSLSKGVEYMRAFKFYLDNPYLKRLESNAFRQNHASLLDTETTQFDGGEWEK